MIDMKNIQAMADWIYQLERMVGDRWMQDGDEKWIIRPIGMSRPGDVSEALGNLHALNYQMAPTIVVSADSPTGQHWLKRGEERREAMTPGYNLDDALVSDQVIAGD